MQKTKIEWTDYVWNPIKGMCPNDCWYCYAIKIYERFNLPQELSLDGRAPILSNKKPRKIFVCSTMEMFHPDIPKEWRDRIFKIIEQDYNQKHTFQILTKFPQNIDRSMPNNVWLGVTVDNVHDFWRARELERKNAKIKFISFEPLLSKIWSEHCYVKGMFKKSLLIDWVIVGRLTGYGKKHDPPREWVEHIVKTCYYSKIPIFIKSNLKEIWEEPLMQEFPCVT